MRYRMSIDSIRTKLDDLNEWYVNPVCDFDLYVNGKQFIKIDDTGCFAWLYRWLITTIGGYRECNTGKNAAFLSETIDHLINRLIRQDGAKQMTKTLETLAANINRDTPLQKTAEKIRVLLSAQPEEPIPELAAPMPQLAEQPFNANSYLIRHVCTPKGIFYESLHPPKGTKKEFSASDLVALQKATKNAANADKFAELLIGRGIELGLYEKGQEVAGWIYKEES